MSLQRQHLSKDPECWSGRGLNQWPSVRQAGTYPFNLSQQIADELLIPSKGRVYPYLSQTILWGRVRGWYWKYYKQ